MFEVTRSNVDAIAGKLAQLKKFLDLPLVLKRITEMEAQMTSDTFWNNQDAARKVIDDLNGLKRKAEPMASVEKRLDDVRVLLELGEAEPPAGQDMIQKEADGELTESPGISTGLNWKCCSPVRTTTAIRSSASRPAPVGPKPRTGPKCCRACTADGSMPAVGSGRSRMRCPAIQPG